MRDSCEPCSRYGGGNGEGAGTPLAWAITARGKVTDRMTGATHAAFSRARFEGDVDDELGLPWSSRTSISSRSSIGDPRGLGSGRGRRLS